MNTFNQQIQILANHEGIFFDQNLKKILFKTFKIVSKPVGIDKSTKNMKQFSIDPYLVDQYSMCYLIDKKPELLQLNLNSKQFFMFYQNLRQSINYRVFYELKDKFFLLNGHKFGSDFLAYDKDPQKNHANYLIFTGLQQKLDLQINHMTRLSQIGKKSCLFVYLNSQKETLQFILIERQKQVQKKASKEKYPAKYHKRHILKVQDL